MHRQLPVMSGTRNGSSLAVFVWIVGPIDCVYIPDAELWVLGLDNLDSTFEIPIDCSNAVVVFGGKVFSKDGADPIDFSAKAAGVVRVAG